MWLYSKRDTYAPMSWIALTFTMTTSAQDKKRGWGNIEQKRVENDTHMMELMREKMNLTLTLYVPIPTPTPSMCLCVGLHYLQEREIHSRSNGNPEDHPAA